MANSGSRANALRRKLKQQNKENLLAADEFALDTAHATSKPSELTEKQLAALAKSEKVRARLDAEFAAKRAAKQQP